MPQITRSDAALSERRQIRLRWTSCCIPATPSGSRQAERPQAIPQQDEAPGPKASLRRVLWPRFSAGPTEDVDTFIFQVEMASTASRYSAEDVKDIVAFAFHVLDKVLAVSGTGATAEEEKVFHFVQGLREPLKASSSAEVMRVSARGQAEYSFDECVDFARMLSRQSANMPARELSDTERPRACIQSMEEGSREPKHASDPLRALLDPFKEAVESIQRSVRALSVQNPTQAMAPVPTGHPARKDDGEGEHRGRPGIRCYFCRKLGHVARNCPMLAKAKKYLQREGTGEQPASLNAAGNTRQ